MSRSQQKQNLQTSNPGEIRKVRLKQFALRYRPREGTQKYQQKMNQLITLISKMIDSILISLSN